MPHRTIGTRALRLLALGVAATVLALALPAGRAAAAADASAATPPRPKVALVLSGGGARGLAHVGVLKILERERIAVDLIVGTSMGAIVGGLYASGMKADDIERELRAIRWDEVFASRVERQELPERRKDQDLEMSAALELGWRAGELRVPQSAVSSMGLETLLRRYTLPVRTITDFDRLPIPFRAVATDMETGEPVELSGGDLAIALRSSMSVPGVFSPIERDGRILGDGGLVNNLPVDLARSHGAEVVLAVNVGTPLSGRETLGSVLGLTAQMINILTEQNVQRSIASLSAKDVLIRPDLQRLGAGDFDKAAELMARGQAAAGAMVKRLAAWSLEPQAYAAWRRSTASPATPRLALSFVTLEGSGLTDVQRLEAQLQSRVGQPFDAATAEQDARRLAASGDFLRADYRLVKRQQGDGLVFEVEDKPWGPHYFRFGIDLSTNFAGRSAFNLKIAHDRRWLSASGTEWRSRLHLGESPLLATELYHPLRWNEQLDADWFISTWGRAELKQLTSFNDQGDELAQYNRTVRQLGMDLGRAFGAWGTARAGLVLSAQRTSPRLLGAQAPLLGRADVWREAALNLRVAADQLDYALFPQRGWRAEIGLQAGQRSGNGSTEAMHRLQLSGTWVSTWGRDTLNLNAQAALSDEGGNAQVGRFTLGGFHNLSGYAAGHLNGNHLVLMRATWYRRLQQSVALTRGFFVGATLEAGNVWMEHGQVSLSNLKVGNSVFLGADTGLGPMYLGITHAPGGSTGLVFFIGRP
jgi:NTE family protein